MDPQEGGYALRLDGECLPPGYRLKRRRTVSVVLCSLSAYQASAGGWERYTDRISCSANRAEEKEEVGIRPIRYEYLNN